MERREFLSWMSLGWVASCLPMAIAACTPQSSEPQAAAPTGSSPVAPAAAAGGFQPVGTVAELDQKGMLMSEKAIGSPVVVVRDPANSQTVLAVNPTCTHRGCTVNWQADRKLYVCPCHGAEYAANGQVTKEPADKNLPTYEAKIEGEAVLVKVG